MTGITLDSPIAAVLGSGKKDASKAKALQENLKLRTVGDLLWHFPRTYLPTGEVSEVAHLVEGQPLTVVADVVNSRVAPYQDRRTGRTAYRVEAVIKTDGPSLKLTMFARNKGVADWQAGRFRPGAKGVFTGKVSQFNGQWQLAHRRW